MIVTSITNMLEVLIWIRLKSLNYIFDCTYKEPASKSSGSGGGVKLFSLKMDSDVVQVREYVCCKDKHSGDLLHTHYMCLAPLENFLSRFEVENLTKNVIFGQKLPDFWPQNDKFSPIFYFLSKLSSISGHRWEVFDGYVALFWKA